MKKFIPHTVIFANGKECMQYNPRRDAESWQGKGKRKKPKVK